MEKINTRLLDEIIDSTKSHSINKEHIAYIGIIILKKYAK